MKILSKNIRVDRNFIEINQKLIQQVRDEHESVFGDLDAMFCSNDEVSVADFHDEICCDISNAE